MPQVFFRVGYFYCALVWDFKIWRNQKEGGMMNVARVICVLVFGLLCQVSQASDDPADMTELCRQGCSVYPSGTDEYNACMYCCLNDCSTNLTQLYIDGRPMTCNVRESAGKTRSIAGEIVAHHPPV